MTLGDVSVVDSDARAAAHAMPRMLDHIVSIQRDYLRNADPTRMWGHLLDAILDVSSSSYGFIGEVDWSQGMPTLETRAMRWVGGVRDATPHPDVGLLVSQVIATEMPLVVNRSSSTSPDDLRFAPMDGFLGLPLVSSDRLVAVVGLTAPSDRYTNRVVEDIEPLLLACAAIIESVQASRERDAVHVRLAATAAFLESVIESSTHGVLVVGAPSGIIESANSSASQIAGRPAATLVGTRVTELVDGRTATWLDRLLTIAGRRGLGPLKGTFQATVGIDGAQHPLEVTLSEFSIEGSLRVVAMVRDLTEQLETERVALRARAVLDQAPDLVAWTDATGRIEYINGGGRRMLGMTAEEVTGSSVHRFVPEWQQDRIMDEVVPTAVFDGFWSGEVTFQGAEGEFPVWLVALAGQDSSHGYLAFLARDLREREEIERMKSRFISNVSHELRTPLTSVLGYVELLRDGSFGELGDGPSEVLEVITKNGQRLLDLIGDILRVTSFDAEVGPQTVPVDLTDVVQSTIDQLDALAGDRRVAMWVSDERLVVAGDRAELEAMLSNLFANAVKFSGPDAEIGITLEASDGFAVLEVSDTGMGIPDEEIPHLFERFHRGEEARRREVQGTGLGLAIVEAVVTRHGGKIEVESTVGVGSTFRVTLPTRERSQ